ncbi:hypothetical protein [Streptomyces sp. TLI_171]|uniref:hypothetical protein n=1 Tax=Streptomyces sp. TLI_171 TaxID=1938859 RepID=UPI001601E0B8|nr:hypothetical protein [Streptomyces sp. TLI_171]
MPISLSLSTAAFAASACAGSALWLAWITSQTSAGSREPYTEAGTIFWVSTRARNWMFLAPGTWLIS